MSWQLCTPGQSKAAWAHKAGRDSTRQPWPRWAHLPFIIFASSYSPSVPQFHPALNPPPGFPVDFALCVYVPTSYNVPYDSHHSPVTAVRVTTDSHCFRHLLCSRVLPTAFNVFTTTTREVFQTNQEQHHQPRRAVGF